MYAPESSECLQRPRGNPAGHWHDSVQILVRFIETLLSGGVYGFLPLTYCTFKHQSMDSIHINTRTYSYNCFILGVVSPKFKKIPHIEEERC